jgi:curved DNA-binding protein
MDYKDYYKILGVPKSASQAEIKKKFRKLAVKYHPDKNEGDESAEQQFKEVNEAYEVLGDAEKRRRYDELGANWKHYDQYQQAKQSGQQRTYQYSGDYSDFFGGGGGFSDFFNSFFGGGSGFAGGSGFSSGGSSFRSKRPKPAASSASLNLTFDEAFQGVAKVVQIDGKKIRLNIKPGSYDGQKIKLSGRGQGGGDLIITLRVEKSNQYDIQGTDLKGKAEMDVATAALGGKLTVNTPHGKVSVPISPGTQPDKKLRLKGKGFPVYGRQGSFGDFIVEVKVKIPSSLTNEQKELFKELQKTL